MTIREAIEQLEKIAARHGDVEVFFDCPQCNRSFTPDVACAVVKVGAFTKGRKTP